MTSTQKSVLTAVCALVLAGGVCEGLAVFSQRTEIRTLAATNAQLTREAAALRAARGRREIASARVAPAVPSTRSAGAGPLAPVEALNAELEAWMARTAQLKALLAAHPELTIPEMKQYLNDDALVSFAASARLDTPTGTRETLAQIRNSARNRLAAKFAEAVRAYLTEHDNVLPADAGEFAPYFPAPFDAAILARYEMTATGKIDGSYWAGGRPAIVRERTAVDPDYDTRLVVFLNGFSLGAFDPMAGAARGAIANFQKANSGAVPTDPAQLVSFTGQPLAPAEQPAFFQAARRLLER